MCLNHLTDDVQIFLCVDFDQYDRQIAGYRITPEAGLPAVVFGQNRTVRTVGGVRIDDRTGKPGIKLGIGFVGVLLVQESLIVRPRDLE